MPTLTIDTSSLTPEQRKALIECGLMNNTCESCGQEISKSIPVQNEYLKLIETVSLRCCNGLRKIANAEDTFKSYIDSDFKNWGLDKRGLSTLATNVSVHEMIKDATFAQMFGSLGSDLDKLCLSQHQIVEFCEKHAAHLRQESYATFFLFEKGDQFCVAAVRVYADGLRVYVYRLEDDAVWSGEYRLHVVVPQLTV